MKYEEMNLPVVDLSQALKLKMLGFDCACVYHYELGSVGLVGNVATDDWGSYHNILDIAWDSNTRPSTVSAPEFALVFKWLREKKEIRVSIAHYWNNDDIPAYMNEDRLFDNQIDMTSFFTYKWDYHKEIRIDSDIKYGTYEEAENAALIEILNWLTQY